MSYTIDLLKKIKDKFSIVLVYLVEAHAADTWPLGFDVL